MAQSGLILFARAPCAFSVLVLLAAISASALAQHSPAAHAATEAARPASGTAQDAERERARFDYVLHCSGCHFLHGEGSPAGGIPRLRDQVGYLLTLPEGRAYLMQVPGLLSAGMRDEEAARVVNWMVDYFSGPSRPARFVPYTGEEARRYRLAKPADIIGIRQRLAAQLRAAGYPFQ
jgi:hypothetical protein